MNLFLVLSERSEIKNLFDPICNKVYASTKVTLAYIGVITECKLGRYTIWEGAGEMMNYLYAIYDIY